MPSDVKAGASVPWAALMTFVLAVLKLTGVISISWWWVFCPLWLVAAVVLVVLVIVLLGAFTYAMVSDR